MLLLTCPLDLVYEVMHHLTSDLPLLTKTVGIYAEKLYQEMVVSMKGHSAEVAVQVPIILSLCTLGVVYSRKQLDGGFLYLG